MPRHKMMCHGQSFLWRTVLAAIASVLATAAGFADQHGEKRIPPDRLINGESAPWNQPVSGLPRDPNSASLTRMLWENASNRPGNLNLNFEEAFALYYAESGMRSYPITIAWDSPLNGQMVPWDPNWRIPPGADRKVIILDPVEGREWDLYQTVFADGRLSATNGSLVPDRYDTYTGTNPPSRGVGIQYAAMLVRPIEVERGRIRHALAMSINNPDGQRFVFPAVKLEHNTGLPGIPEGTRFALDCTDSEIDMWVQSLPSGIRAAMGDSARIIARALREYGWFITDSNGAGSFEFEARASAEEQWIKLGLGEVMAAQGKIYPRDLLDGLITPERIYALAPGSH